MRFFLLVFLFLSGLPSHAQRPSRIVFFRIEGESTNSVEANNALQRRAALLMKGETQIADMTTRSLLIYDNAGTDGSYFFALDANGDSVSNMLKVRELDGGIAFVRIGNDEFNPNRMALQAVSFGNFQNYFKEQAWMSKAIRKAGYPSIADLTKGYETLPLAQVLPRKPALSIGDTVFYDRTGRKTDRPNASWFRIAARDSNRLFRVTEYYIPGNGVKSRGQFSTLDSVSRTGMYEDFFRSGAMESRGRYANNKTEGLWTFFRDTTVSKTWYTIVYRNGKHDGVLRSYYRDGSLKRKEIRKIFHDTLRDYDADPQPRIIDRDSLISGTCYDRQGGEIPFTAMRVMPQAEFGLAEFLQQTLRYPRSAQNRGVEGRVIVQFTVAANGEVEDAEVIRRTDPLLDAEALRVVRAMPRWKPGIQDDSPVGVYFSLPITFKLD